jgi:hypothetical protein
MPPAHLLGPRTPNSEHVGGCSGKHAFSSRADAKAVVKDRPHLKSTYLCRHCGHWHVSKMRTRGKA